MMYKVLLYLKYKMNTLITNISSSVILKLVWSYHSLSHLFSSNSGPSGLSSSTWSWFLSLVFYMRSFDDLEFEAPEAVRLSLSILFSSILAFSSAHCGSFLCFLNMWRSRSLLERTVLPHILHSHKYLFSWVCLTWVPQVDLFENTFPQRWHVTGSNFPLIFVWSFWLCVSNCELFSNLILQEVQLYSTGLSNKQLLLPSCKCPNDKLNFDRTVF